MLNQTNASKFPKSPPSSPANPKSQISKHNFSFLYVIGKGGFGRVWKVKNKKTEKLYALKEMSKLKVLDKKSENSINSELKFLSKLNHPFLVNVHYAFQDNDSLYLAMDLLTGGDLRYHISRYRKFSEEQTRFFISCLIYTLSYIHENNVIHRDIKPENLVLDENGYLRITDFGIAKENSIDNSSETSGTPGYMSPEVMRGKNHSFSVDFFAIGIIGYEFMLGRRPYNGRNRREIKEKMLAKQAKISKDNICHGWSLESADFINKCLERKPEKRIGNNNGAIELMMHPWLKYYPWDELKEKKLLAPFIPEKKDNFDRRYCEGVDKISAETKMRYEEIYGGEKFKSAFCLFYYNEDEVKEKENEKEKKKEKEKEEKIKVEKQFLTLNKDNSKINIHNNIKGNQEKDEKENENQSINTKYHSRSNSNLLIDKSNLYSNNNNINININNKVNNIQINSTRKQFSHLSNNFIKSKSSSNFTKNKKSNLISNEKKMIQNQNIRQQLLQNDISKNLVNKSHSKEKHKALSHSTSSRDITISKNKLNSNSKNSYRTINHQKSYKYINKLIPSSSKQILFKNHPKGKTLLHNYYSNNLLSVYKKSQNYSSNISQNKIFHNRASSVLVSKRVPKPDNKFRNKVKLEKNNSTSSTINTNNSNNKNIYQNKKLSRVNSSNKILAKKSSEYVYNKIKSMSISNSIMNMNVPVFK